MKRGEMLENFKKALFSSGLPLEYSAEGVLRRRNFGDVVGDFAFSRAGAQGEMSVDLAAGKTVFSESLEREVRGEIEILKVIANWRVLLEAKYRTDNASWIFAPYDGPSDHLSDYSHWQERHSHIRFGVLSSAEVAFRPVHLGLTSHAHYALTAPPICLRGIESRSVGTADALPANIGETLSPSEISVQGGEVQGR